MKTGDRVKLVNRTYSLSESDPRWGTRFSCVGTVGRFRQLGNRFYVYWGNNCSNTYIQSDLALVDKKDLKQLPNIIKEASKAPRRRNIKIKQSLHNRFSKALNRFNNKKDNYDEEKRPSCYLLGADKKKVLVDMVSLRKDTDNDDCSQMTAINARTISKAMIKLIGKNLVPIGIIRIGDCKLGMGGDYIDRGDSLRELSNLNKNAIMITYTNSGIEIESYDKDNNYDNTLYHNYQIEKATK